MERKPKLRHCDGSTSFNSLEGLHDYFSGKTSFEDIPHNESPINKYVDTAFPGLRETVKSIGKGSTEKPMKQGEVRSLDSIKKKGTEPM